MKQFSESIVNHSSPSGTEGFLLNGTDLVCLSHLRWDVVDQQPQSLLNRCTQNRRVFFIEAPIIEFIDSWWLEVSQRECGVWVVVPHLPDWVSDELMTAMHQSLMDELFETYAIANPILWYHTPTALSYTNHLKSSTVVYDCMDERFASQGVSPALRELERQLVQRADAVFMDGQVLHGPKQQLYSNSSVFPSRICS